MSVTIIILGAGRGTRMGGSLPKVLHEVAGCNMLEHVLMAAQSLDSQDIRVVASPELVNHKVAQELQAKYPYTIAIQTERLGTADATRCGIATGPSRERTIVLYGDAPLITGKTLQNMNQAMNENPGAKVLCLGFHSSNPYGYGRLVVAGTDTLLGIVEEREANAEQKAIELCNSGIIMFDSATLPELLSSIGNENTSGEYYLTDTVKIAVRRGIECIYMLTEEDEVLGVNNYAQLAAAEIAMQQRLRNQLLESGVRMLAPDTVFLAADTKIEAGATLHPYVVIGKGVTIDTATEILPFSYVEYSIIGQGCRVGPFARLRGNNNLSQNTHIGNFVEVKNSNIGAGSKAGHLAYIGDADIQEGVNIGANTVFCNYDGFKKHRTTVGKEAFIGSGTCIIAPCDIADAALVAAGSTITKNVGADEMAIARQRQVNLPKKGMAMRKVVKNQK